MSGWICNFTLASPEALDYLKHRGLLHLDLIEYHPLGLCDRTMGYRIQPTRWKAGRKLRSQLQRLGVLKATGHEALRGSLVMPITNPDGRIVDAYGRKVGQRLRAGTPLHTRWQEPARGVWNVLALGVFDEVIVAKSSMDGLTWWAHGFRNVVVGEADANVAAVEERGAPMRLVLAFDAGERGAVTRKQP